MEGNSHLLNKLSTYTAEKFEGHLPPYSQKTLQHFAVLYVNIFGECKAVTAIFTAIKIKINEQNEI